jgi:hypothetical protein
LSITYFCQTKKCCDDLLAKLEANNLNPSFMLKVKYVCEQEGELYYHNKILKQIANPIAIKDLGDISLFATYFNYTVAELNETPYKLYDNFNNFEEKTDIAARLSHLEGIKYLWGDNTTTFYEQDSKTIQKRLLSIIICKDLDAFQQTLVIYKNTINTTQTLNYYIKSAYQYGSLAIAIELIKNGVKFDIKYMMDIYPSLDYFKYVEHINFLRKEKFIDDKVYEGAQALINAMFCGTFYRSSNIFDKINMLIHSECNFLKKITDINYNEVTKPLFGVMLAIHFPHIVIPSKSIAVPFCMPLNQYYKVYGGDPKDNYFLSKLIHELTHAFLYVIYQNNSRPYPKHESGGTSVAYEAYQKAKTIFFKNVFIELGIKKDEIDNFTELESVLANNIQLNLNEYCYNKHSKNTIFTIILDKYASSNWSLSILLNTKVLDELITKVGGQSTLTQLISIEKNIKDNKKSENFLDMIIAELRVNKEQSENIVILYSKIKNEMKQILNNFCTEQTLDNEYSMFLSRIFDYVKRSPTDWDTELLPRFTEVYLDGKENKIAKQLYKPLLEYWVKYVVPEANKVITADYAYKSDIFIEKDKTFSEQLFSKINDLIFGPQEEIQKSIGDVLELNYAAQGFIGFENDMC